MCPMWPITFENISVLFTLTEYVFYSITQNWHLTCWVNVKSLVIILNYSRQVISPWRPKTNHFYLSSFGWQYIFSLRILQTPPLLHTSLPTHVSNTCSSIEPARPCGNNSNMELQLWYNNCSWSACRLIFPKSTITFLSYS